MNMNLSLVSLPYRIIKNNVHKNMSMELTITSFTINLNKCLFIIHICVSVHTKISRCIDHFITSYL